MATDAALALPPAAPPARPRVLLVGTALTAAASFMAIMGMLGVYLSQRASMITGGEPWLPDGSVLPLTPGNMAMATLLISAVTMWWAVDAVGNNDRPSAYLALGLTIMFGIAAINATTFIFAGLNLPVATIQGLLLYAVAGTHIAMTVGGLIFAGVMTLRTLGGEYHGRDREGLVAAAIFWYVTIAAYAVIWYAIFITK